MKNENGFVRATLGRVRRFAGKLKDDEGKTASKLAG
jgi:hypothetical protein